MVRESIIGVKRDLLQDHLDKGTDTLNAATSNVQSIVGSARNEDLQRQICRCGMKCKRLHLASQLRATSCVNAASSFETSSSTRWR